MIRYDACYAVLFKCSRRRISDYPNITAWMRDVYQITVGEHSDLQVPAFTHTVDCLPCMQASRGVVGRMQ